MSWTDGPHKSWYHGTVTSYDTRGGFRIDYDDEDVQFGFFGQHVFKNTGDNQESEYRWLEDGQEEKTTQPDLQRASAQFGATDQSTDDVFLDRWDGGQPTDMSSPEDEDFKPSRIPRKGDSCPHNDDGSTKAKARHLKKKHKERSKSRSQPSELDTVEQPVKRKRGRPRKVDNQSAQPKLTGEQGSKQAHAQGGKNAAKVQSLP